MHLPTSVHSPSTVIVIAVVGSKLSNEPGIFNEVDSFFETPVVSKNVLEGRPPFPPRLLIPYPSAEFMKVAAAEQYMLYRLISLPALTASSIVAWHPSKMEV